MSGMSVTSLADQLGGHLRMLGHQIMTIDSQLAQPHAFGESAATYRPRVNRGFAQEEFAEGFAAAQPEWSAAASTMTSAARARVL